MDNDIKNILSKHKSNYSKIPIESIKKIHDLLVNNMIYNPLNDIEMYYLGWYYKHIEKDYANMKKYLLMAINKGNTYAMYSLGLYYHHIDKNLMNDDHNLTKKYYGLMKKYYLMAINKGNSMAMNNLGWHYQEIENNHDQMKKYYLMAIDKGDSTAMNNLGWHYEHIEKDYDMMKKYYLMAVDKGCSHTMRNLGSYYNVNNLWIEKIIDFYQHNIEITDDHVLEMFTKCKITDDKLMDLIQTVDLRSYEHCPKIIKIAQNSYIQSIKNELTACNKCPKELVKLTISFLYK